MRATRKAISSIIRPIVENLGYHYMEDNSGNTCIVFAKKSNNDLYSLILAGRVMSGDGSFSIEISLSPSTNPGLKGRDIPSSSIRQLGALFWTVDMLSKDSLLSECISIAENEMLLDEVMIIELKQSKKLLLEVQLEKWVISWYNEKEESQLPLFSFIQYTPKESIDGIDIKWFVVAEIVLRLTWVPMNKDRIYSLATQAYWKYSLDSAA